MINRNRKAFTLMELLVVISMIGILTTVSLVGLGSYRTRGRDAQRIADINSIAVALQNYYADNHQYPNTLNALTTPKAYLTSVPSDPKPGNPPYNYTSVAPFSSYTLYATLEIPASSTYQYQNGELTSSP